MTKIKRILENKAEDCLYVQVGEDTYIGFTKSILRNNALVIESILVGMPYLTTTKASIEAHFGPLSNFEDVTDEYSHYTH